MARQALYFGFVEDCQSNFASVEVSREQFHLDLMIRLEVVHVAGHCSWRILCPGMTNQVVDMEVVLIFRQAAACPEVSSDHSLEQSHLL